MKTVLLSRTDRIGDVILTLPMAGLIKRWFPDYRILFLAQEYTRVIAENCRYIDEVYDWEKVKTREEFLPHIDYFFHVLPDPRIAFFAQKLRISHRVGTSHRFYHWITCNNLRPFSRKRSNLHEAQLNIKLLRPLGITEIPPLSEMHQLVGWKKKPVKIKSKVTVSEKKFNLIFHIKSMGSAKEWPAVNYLHLAKQLPTDQYQIYITGTTNEGKLIRNEVPQIFSLPNVTDITGKFDLKGFISFVHDCDGLLACSTGPLHIAAVAGLKSLGLYPKARPMHAGRWAPIGESVEVISEKQIKDNSYLNISVEEVAGKILHWV